jgi:hypothetical protein
MIHLTARITTEDNNKWKVCGLRKLSYNREKIDL